jgi:hypothetical protein
MYAYCIFTVLVDVLGRVQCTKSVLKVGGITHSTITIGVLWKIEKFFGHLISSLLVIIYTEGEDNINCYLQ